MTDVYSSMFQNAVAAVLFAVIGVLLFILAFMLFDKLTPGSLWKLIEDQNTALGVLMGAVAIAWRSSSRRRCTERWRSAAGERFGRLSSRTQACLRMPGAGVGRRRRRQPTTNR
jgi:hypothetical protein